MARRTPTNKVEVIGLDGVTWYLWLHEVRNEQLGAEILRALKVYPKIRVNDFVICQEAERSVARAA